MSASGGKRTAPRGPKNVAIGVAGVKTKVCQPVLIPSVAAGALLAVEMAPNRGKEVVK